MKIFGSKTLNINAFIMALIGVAMAFGIEVPGEVSAGIVAVVNFILRFFTEKPISEKLNE